MTVSFVCRQAVILARVLVEHVGSDPVFFGVQVSRRLPRTASRAVGRQLHRVPAPACQIAAKWLTGDAAGAKEDLRKQLSAKNLGAFSARLFGEFALSLRMTGEAAAFADRISKPKAARNLRARIAWQNGDMTGAVSIAGEGRLHSRLKSESQLYEPAWKPALSARITQPAVVESDVLYMLTNSLPHTQSGYTLRSHALLTAVQRRGLRVVAGTRTGYPVSVGRFSRRDRDSIDGVTYLRDVPWDQGRTAAQRLQKQAEFTAGLAAASRAQVLHTTTHFVNGVATAAAAEKLGLPWVYEVRGVLEETWAASAASDEERQRARRSERYELFRSRETELALNADRVVTLGATMAHELMRRGIPEDRILIAPNAVSTELLDREINESPSAVREANGLAKDGVWVGTAASIVGYEGLDVLIDAARIARREGTDLRVLIIGDGVELPALMQQAESLGDAAVFTGRLPQRKAQELITGLDIFAVPRRNDPVCSLVTPLKPVEAAGLSRPVVLSDLPALVEALPAEARSAVSAGSAEQWAQELVRLAASVDLRQQMGLAGHRFVTQHRTWEAVGHSYARMYTALGVGGMT